MTQASVLSRYRPPSYVLSCAQMRAVERDVLVRSGLPSVILMENAGRGVTGVILRRATIPSGRPLTVAIVCGAGNNGGDGFVVARHLAQSGAWIRVLLAAPRERLTGDAAIMLHALRDVPDVVISELGEESDVQTWRRALRDVDVVVDALFGTGLRDDVAGVPATAIAAMNAASGMKVAVTRADRALRPCAPT
jgi:ADP-dependent NAD(P)H-hydrate dehydratase / NAD(P)H-hydrate epimerase